MGLDLGWYKGNGEKRGKSWEFSLVMSFAMTC